jgi:ssRNA-specific RNase YbeY (16S rRNA maturation enzyme)
VLHLTGHDHLDLQDTELMQSRERAALEKLNINA